MNLKTWMDERVTAALITRRDYLERMAAAYILHTDIPPDEVTLCEQMGADGVLRWWFERRADRIG